MQSKTSDDQADDISLRHQGLPSLLNSAQVTLGRCFKADHASDCEAKGNSGKHISAARASCSQKNLVGLGQEPDSNMMTCMTPGPVTTFSIPSNRELCRRTGPLLSRVGKQSKEGLCSHFTVASSLLTTTVTVREQ